MELTELDKQVLEAVRSGKKKNAEIHASIQVEYRTLDRALQRLRKAGKIRYASQKEGWVLA